MDNKGQVGAIPQYVITFVLIGLIVAVGLVVLDKFMGVSGLSQVSVDAINNTIDSIAPITTDWLPIFA